MTSTDLATRGGSDLVLPVTSSELSTLDQLRGWLESAHIAEQIAAVVCMGPFAPKGFRGNKESTATAILAGMELGFSPSRALRSFYVVEGTATLSAEAMRALILSKGHEFEIMERSAERCTVRGRRRGENDWTEVVWTIEDAIRAKLVERGPDGVLKGSRDPWWKYPATMLSNRATTDLGKLKFADVIGGMDGTEELQDADPAQVRVEVVDPDRGRAQVAAILAAAEPTVAERRDEAAAEILATMAQATQEPAPAAPAADPDGPVGNRTWAAMNSRFVGLGVTGPGQGFRRQSVIVAILGRQVSDRGQITEAEGQQVLDNLAGEAGKRLVADVLNPPAGRQEADEAAAVSEAHAAAEAEQTYSSTPDEYDPTMGDDWSPMDGGEAAGESNL